MTSYTSLRRRSKIRSATTVGAVAVHGACGAWGTLAAGVSAKAVDVVSGHTTLQTTLRLRDYRFFLIGGQRKWRIQ